MKYYAEILHPIQPEQVVWHYYLEAPDEESARGAAGDQFLKEDIAKDLLMLGGMFIVTVEEDKRDALGKWPEGSV